ncbi:putative HMG box-containing protein C10F6.08c [Venustampulla echinocandica]|uniref:Putative HMG box-containing protein C10F6.08c n=1 Tax=Venustampulla echinocandica TaxID=2656787 RepID=A0A370TGJ9_9HELO|nr:putative HMG box-containing protein C10F6.08c [Venustampulla echinocandica]RDL34324.1 putative HMG box-containing protein C10F6.08c [Venustampulla echinocandica]
MAPPPATAGSVPPPLAPSVEEAYRRKCIQLKQRINEIDHDNDAARLRVVRLERGVQKLRLERAFLLEQLAKRTSTNVEDSEGSPSPPPTPKEKPLRTKRGHRKPSYLTNLGEPSATNAFIQQGPVTLSPSSDAFSHTHHDSNLGRNSTPQAQPSNRLLPTSSNGVAAKNAPTSTSTPPFRKPKSAFDLYCQDLRSVVAVTNRKGLADGSYDIEEGLARGWRDMNEEQKNEFQSRFDKMKKGAGAEKDTVTAPTAPKQAVTDGESRTDNAAGTTNDADEDVEMGEDGDEPPAAPAEGGFTAVNRG